jgi:hypothetical protein
MSLYGLSGLEAVAATLVIGILAILASVAADFIVRRGEPESTTLRRAPRPSMGRAAGRHTPPAVEERTVPVAAARRDAFA